MNSPARSMAALALLGSAAALAAQEPIKTKPEAEYAELSRLIQKMVVAQVPKVIEDNSGWTGSVPVPPNLKLPRLKRELIKVGDRWELPHGVWRKMKVWLPDPAKDLTIRVRDFKPVEAKTYRLTLDADVALRGWAEVQHWQKGLALVGFIAEADALLGLSLECDVGIALDTTKFPPDVKVAPKVNELKTDLKDITLRSVALRRLGVVLEGEAARDAGNQFKGMLQDLLRRYEPDIKDHANRAIERSLREGKGTLNAAELLKKLDK